MHLACYRADARERFQKPAAVKALRAPVASGHDLVTVNAPLSVMGAAAEQSDEPAHHGRTARTNQPGGPGSGHSIDRQPNRSNISDSAPGMNLHRSGGL